LAVSRGDALLVKLLIQCGHPLTVRNNLLQTPYDVCVYKEGTIASLLKEDHFAGSTVPDERKTCTLL